MGRRKVQNTDKSENFDVILKSDVSDDNGNEVTIITSDQLSEKWLTQAMNNYDPTNRIYSAYLNDRLDYPTSISIDLLNKLALNPQSNLNDILAINSIVRQYINKDDIIGKTYETIESNVNTNYKLSYNDFSAQRNKNKMLDKSKTIIDDFNNKINIKYLIRNIVPTVYSEGNYCMYLRKQNGNYIVDYYPLSVVEVSDYESNGEPYLLINMQKLLSKLLKTQVTTNKGNPLFFKDLDTEIQSNYPPEVYQAYKNKDNYVKLDIRYSAIIRIGNMNRKYGLTPIFRALKSALMLETFDHTDLVNSKAKAKKIIHQTLREKLMGDSGDKKGFEEMAYAHDNLMKAWKMPTVVVTTPPFVESIEYVEPKVENTNFDTVSQYRSREMIALGITFLASDKGQTVTTASMSIKELIKTIDKITEQIADVLNKWYRVILADNNIPIDYAPTIVINSSEELSLEIKKQLAEFMFCKLGCSFSTAYGIMNIDINDEKQKRIQENDEQYGDIFMPRPTAYTLTDKAEEPNADKGGRPKEDTPNNKQTYDKERNQNKSK